jgi:hypothetical protein
MASCHGAFSLLSASGCGNHVATHKRTVINIILDNEFFRFCRINELMINYLRSKFFDMLSMVPYDMLHP